MRANADMKDRERQAHPWPDVLCLRKAGVSASKAACPQPTPLPKSEASQVIYRPKIDLRCNVWPSTDCPHLDEDW